MGASESVFMLRAHSSTSSAERTRKGFFFTPGFLRMPARFCGQGKGGLHETPHRMPSQPAPTSAAKRQAARYGG
jgi:hypothetical protein